MSVFSLWIVVAACIVPVPAIAQDPPVLEVGKFSTAVEGAALPDGWRPLTFKKVPKETKYEVISDNGVTVIRAVSEASASGLTKAVRIDPKEFPVVRWRWKTDDLVKNSDVRRKDGDDYPVRLYITFEYDSGKVGLSRRLKYKAAQVLFGEVPIAALNYIWGTATPVGTIVENAYTDFARMIVVQSGPQRLGRWVDEERNVYEDYVRAFGEEPPVINGVAIMSDTDNTRERVTAYYGDITFARRRF